MGFRNNVFTVVLAVLVFLTAPINANAFYDTACSPEKSALDRTRSRYMLGPVGLSTMVSGFTYGITRERFARDHGDSETGYGVLSISSMIVGFITGASAGGECTFKSASEPSLELTPDDYVRSNRFTIIASTLNVGLNGWMLLSTDSSTSRWFNGAAVLVPFVTAYIFRDNFETDRTMKGSEIHVGLGCQSQTTGQLLPGFTIQFNL